MSNTFLLVARMFYSHQLLARKAPLGQIWLAATLDLKKINRKRLKELNLIEICNQILYPSAPMALRLSGILMGGVVIIYQKKMKLLLDDANRLLWQINKVWRKKALGDTSLLSRSKKRARKEDITLPEAAAEQEDLGQHSQADINKITISDEIYRESALRFERFDIAGDDETQSILDLPLIPSPPRHHSILEGANFTSQEQVYVRDAFAEQMEEQQILDREEYHMSRPAKRRRNLTATVEMDTAQTFIPAAALEMDNKQTILSNLKYKSWLDDASDILTIKRNLGRRTTSRKKIPLTQVFIKHLVVTPCPPMFHELWSKCTKFHEPSTSETRIPDFLTKQSPEFVQERTPNPHQTDHEDHGEGIRSQNIPCPTEKTRTENIKGKTWGSFSSPPIADYNSLHKETPVSIPCSEIPGPTLDINSPREMPSRERPDSSPRIGVEPALLVEDRQLEHGDDDIEFSTDHEVLVDSGPIQTQNPEFSHSEEKITDSIKSQLKTHFETPGAPEVESLNKLAVGMDRNAAAKLFFQSCVLATRGVIKVKQRQPYGDILIERGPNM